MHVAAGLDQRAVQLGRLATVEPYGVRGRYASGSMISTADDLRRFALGLREDGFLSAASRLELHRQFRTDRQEFTTLGGPVVTGSGFVTGWRSYLRDHPREQHLVILLNNVTVLPPGAIADIGIDCIRIVRGEAPRGVREGGEELQVRSIDEGLPETDLARAAVAFVDAVRAEDVDELVAWHERHGVDLSADEVEALAARLVGLPERIGGFELAVFQDGGADRLLLGVRGTAPFDVLLTFVVREHEPLALEPVRIGQARR